MPDNPARGELGHIETIDGNRYVLVEIDNPFGTNNPRIPDRVCVYRKCEDKV